MMRILALLIIFSSLPFDIFGQDSTLTKVRDQLEAAFEEIEDDDAGEQLIQFLQDLENNPVNINTADITDLLQIPGLSFVTARSIINYREEKLFRSKEDLLKVRGIGQVTYQKISPYITIGNGREQQKGLVFDRQYWLNNAKFEVISRYQQVLEEQDGYVIPDSLGGYTGNSLKYYQRFKLRSNHLLFNLTQEKDAGEKLQNPTDFDFNSIHLGFINHGRLKKLIIGDYSLSFGQGLVIWSGGAFGKGREVINSIGRNERGLRGYTSSQESNFFRGVAASIGDRNELTVFYSNVPQTASIVGQDSVRYPSTSGFHRTINEIERRNNVDQTTIGARFRLNTRFGLFGVTGFSSSFSSTVIRGSSISNLSDFNGKANNVLGLDYRALIRKSIIFGELAYSDKEAFSGLIGVKSNVGSSTDLAFVFRNYDSQFISILGDGFGELSGTPQNERGLYIGLKHRISKCIVSTYVDQYFFEAPNAGTLTPSSGIDVLAMVEANFSAQLNAYFLIRNETKDDAYSSIDDMGREHLLAGSRSRSSYRIQIQHQPNKTIRTRSRMEWVRFINDELEPENGYLLFQDIRVNATEKLLLDTRFTLFDTDSFNARVYQFENDLRYVLTNTSLNNAGQRWYLVAKYDLSDQLEISAKFSRTTFEDTQVVSSGLNRIEGNKRSFVGIQIRWEF